MTTFSLARPVPQEWPRINKARPVPVHYHGCVPDAAGLADRDAFANWSELPGMAFSSRRQVELLTSLGEESGEERRWGASRPANSDEGRYFTENDRLSVGCAASAHYAIRRVKPSMVMEIGSGRSSTVITRAWASNLAESGARARHAARC